MRMNSFHSVKFIDHMKRRFPLACYSYFIFFALLAVVNFRHGLLFIFYGLAAMLFFPGIAAELGIKFAIKKSRKIFALLGFAVFLTSLPLVAHYNQLDERSVQQHHAAEIQKEQVAEQRHDSLTKYLGRAGGLKDSNPDSALWYLNYGSQYAAGEEEGDTIRNLVSQIAGKKVDRLMKKRNFKTARLLLDSLIADDASNADLLYRRAICFQRTGLLKDAVVDLKNAAGLGDPRAGSLFDKINPARKVIVGYITRCCDGSTSYARGRGACSHHGGVCNWNEPVYEEHRKYE